MAFDVNQFIAQKKAGGLAPTAQRFDVNKFLESRGADIAQPRKAVIPSSLLKTQGGLQTATKVSGLEPEATRVLAGKGESPEKIFSGGVITDIFDVLNTLQYGVVGLLKGKTFGEGVQTRESFTRRDPESPFEKAGLPHFPLIALDILVDPLSWINPAALASKISKVPTLAKAGKAVQPAISAVKESKVANFFGSRFIYRFGQDPIYRAMDERRIKNIGVGTESLIELVRPIAKLDPKTQQLIANARKLGQLENLPDDLRQLARPAFDELDKLGKQAVEAGLLSQKVYDENVGTYLARFYRSKEAEGEATKALKGLFPSKPLRIDLSRFKARTDIPEEVRQAMGEVLEAGYPTAKALVQLKNAVENANFFKATSERFAKDSLEEGFSLLPKTDRLGLLSGKSVPTPIADSINEIVRSRSALEKAQGIIVGGFKFSKVILNPATHARNIVSNFILNSWEGLNPLTPAGIKAYGLAAKELVTAGPMYREAKSVGLGLDNFAANEIRGFLDSPEVASLGGKVKGAMQRVADIYQKEEEFAKLSQYIFQRTKNQLPPEKAWQIAERATFNYAQVTPFIRRMRESLFGFPFITFTYKATPQAIKTAVTKPTRISNIGKLKNAIENQTNQAELQAERESEPDWIRDGFFVKLPIKDENGRSAYFDLTYILPFGDLISGNYLETGVNRETGLPETPARAGLRKTPFLGLIAELAENKDFFGNRIVKDSDSLDKKLGDVFRHVTKTYLPPLIADQIPGGYRRDGTRKPGTLQTVIGKELGLEEGGAQTRSLIQEMLKQVGLKVTPVDLLLQQKYSETERIRALQTLLKDEGIISSFEIPFSPKN